MASTSAASRLVGQSDFFFGWDLLYKTIENVINKKSDVIIALAHFMLIKHSNFRCIGVGEDKTLQESDVGTELLPDDWNIDEHKYALRYVYHDQLYLLLANTSEDCLILNLLDVKTKKVSNIAVEPDTMVKQIKGPISTLIPDVSLLTTRFQKELIDPVVIGTTTEVTTQTPTERNSSLLVGSTHGPPRYMPDHGYIPQVPHNPPFGFPNVGRGDLDPLGRGGGGNLFPFPSRPDFHGVPRYDPYGPPEHGGIPANPNPDHLQPPDFPQAQPRPGQLPRRPPNGYDDYYM